MELITKIAKNNTKSELSKIKQSKSVNPIPSSPSIPETKNNTIKTEGKNTGIQKLISHILDGKIDEMEKEINPEHLRIKNNLLLILLVLSAYGVYYLIGDFLDVLLIAYIAGIAYHETRIKFTNFITDAKSYEGHNQSWQKRGMKIGIWILIGFVFPRIKYLLSHPHKINTFPSLTDYFKSIQKIDGYIVIGCEILIGLYILYLILGPSLKKVGQKIRPTNEQCVRVFFALLTVFVVVFLTIVIPSILLKEISSVGFLVEQKVEQKLGCKLISLKENTNTTELPHCSEKLTTENTFIKETIEEFVEQNKTLEECLIFLEKFRDDYLTEYIKQFPSIGKNIYYYEEILCTWYSFIEKTISYSGFTIQEGAQKFELHDVFSTGQNIFKLLFGNLAWILSTISNSLFSLTTFITTFVLTCKYYSENSSNTMKQILSTNKQELISSITNLVMATFFIVLWHFALSVLLLEIFGITPINLMMSIVLASMAMFPFVRPWLGVLVVSIIRMLVIEEYYISIIFVLIYYLMSEKIYSIHYRKMELHEIVTNMSVLFGIYQFGVAGILYGPLIIVLYQCVQRELFKKCGHDDGWGEDEISK